jgi:hypothetical protein
LDCNTSSPPQRYARRERAVRGTKTTTEGTLVQVSSGLMPTHRSPPAAIPHSTAHLKFVETSTGRVRSVPSETGGEKIKQRIVRKVLWPAKKLFRKWNDLVRRAVCACVLVQCRMTTARPSPSRWSTRQVKSASMYIVVVARVRRGK